MDKPRQWIPSRKEFHAEVISFGRITIPLIVRNSLRLKEGSIVCVNLGLDSKRNNMKTFHSEVISGGRITIPKFVRKVFSLKDGMMVFVSVSPENIENVETVVVQNVGQ